jgi:hypothetical protein
MKHAKVRGSLMSILIILCSLLVFPGCHKEMSGQQNSNGHTSLQIFLTDDPAVVMDHVFLNIIKVEVKAEDADQLEQEHQHEAESDDEDRHGSMSGGWIQLDVAGGIHDILQFRNGLDTLLATGNFPSINKIKKLRITVGGSNSVVFQGQSFPLVIKDENNTILIKLDDDFAPSNVQGLLEFSLDFDAGRSIRMQNNNFEWHSSIRAFRHENSGAIEGTVLPGSAAASITATNGTDTATASPEREGEFKITGLKPGTYTVSFHANSGNFQDTVLQQVIVNAGEDTHLQAVTLHP